MPEQKATAKTETAAGEKCCVAKCKQSVRAKGYCRKHYAAWRRGKIGKKQRYKTCSKEGCRKPVVAGGVCAEHKKGAPAEGAAPAA
jgi:hypothetical protein